MPATQRQTLEILIDRAGGDGLHPVTAYARVTNQSARGAFLPPFRTEDLRHIERQLVEATAAPAGTSAGASMQDFGERLFTALFHDDVLALYDQLTDNPAQPPTLWFVSNESSIAQTPWELLYDARGRGWLAGSLPLVRGLNVKQQPDLRPAVNGPLRVLMASAFPAGLEPWPGEDEFQQVARSLHGTTNLLTLEHLPHATISLLQNALREAQERGAPFHVFHLVSHGLVDPTTGASALLVEDAQGQPAQLIPSDLASLLSGYGIQCVFLNACASAAAPAQGLTQGFVSALFAIGVPTLVGMQVPLTASAAVLFAKEFYAALADGRSVEAALLDVRRVAQQDGGTPAVPVCYTRVLPAILAASDGGKAGLPPWWRRAWRRLAAGAALLVAFVGGYMTLRDFLCEPPLLTGLPVALYNTCSVIKPEPTPAPVLTLPSATAPPITVLPPPPTPTPWLAGDFNIAVAEIAAADGNPLVNAKGAELAQLLHEALQGAFAQAEPTSYRIAANLPPQAVGVIDGPESFEQEENAARRARAINADLLIYGNLDAQPYQTTLDLYVYLAPRQLATAEEMAGVYPLLHITSSGDIDNNAVTSSEVRNQLLAQANMAAQLVFGIGYFNRQQYAEAAAHLAAVQSDLDALGQKGLDDADALAAPLALFRGTAAAQQGDLPLAHQYYQAAVDSDPNYARAYIARGQIVFLQARQGCKAGQTDVTAILNDALNDYSTALDLPAGPPAAISTKVNLHRGTAYLCLAMAGAGSEYWELAKQHLDNVLRDYGDGKNPALQYLAAQAHDRLGVRAMSLWSSGLQAAADTTPALGDPALLNEAAAAFERAVALSRVPRELALTHLWLALIGAVQQDCQSARTHEQDAQAAFEQAAALDSTSPAFVQWKDGWNQLYAQVMPALTFYCPAAGAVPTGLAQNPWRQRANGT